MVEMGLVSQKGLSSPDHKEEIFFSAKLIIFDIRETVKRTEAVSG